MRAASVADGAARDGVGANALLAAPARVEPQHRNAPTTLHEDLRRESDSCLCAVAIQIARRDGFRSTGRGGRGVGAKKFSAPAPACSRANTLRSMRMASLYV